MFHLYRPAMDSATHLLEQLARNLNAHDALRADLTSTIKGVIVFDIDGAGRWVLDLREGKGTLKRSGGGAGGGSDEGGDAEEETDADLVLTMSGDTFVKLVAKKMTSQQAFLTRKLKIKGSMGMAMKLQPVLDAAVDTPSKL